MPTAIHAFCSKTALLGNGPRVFAKNTLYEQNWYGRPDSQHGRAPTLPANPTQGPHTLPGQTCFERRLRTHFEEREKAIGEKSETEKTPAFVLYVYMLFLFGYLLYTRLNITPSTPDPPPRPKHTTHTYNNGASV